MGDGRRSDRTHGTDRKDILDDLIPMNNEALEKAKIPFRASTLYMWRGMGKYPELFVKIGGKLFVNRREFVRMVERRMFENAEEKKAQRRQMEILKKKVFF